MDAKQCVVFYATKWRDKYRRNYPIAWGKETLMMKRLLALYSPDELGTLITHYFEDFKDAFADKTGRKIQVFIGQLPEVIAALDRAEEERKKAAANPDFERLEQARKARTREGAK